MDDNARKFITQPLAPNLLKEHNATSFLLTTDWLETAEDTERKLAYKKFETGEVTILLISKATKDGRRVSEKKKISEQEYKELLATAILHIEKKRSDFIFVQNGIEFSIKYDEFVNSDLKILEVDVESEIERNKFDPKDFSVALKEVTGDIRYYGYRIAGVLFSREN
jgi:hypothetical protein